MYFITNKTVIEKANNKLQFKDSNELSQSLRYCRRLDGQMFEEVGSQAFMQHLMASADKEILFYIHGFNNQPHEHIFPRADAMQNQLKDGGLGRVTVIPIIWPCDDDFGVIQDYWDDQESAEFSGIFFSRAISKLTAWQEKQKEPCKKRMHLMAHSMGARVLMKGLSYWACRYGGGGVPYLFKNIFLMASDIPNEALEKSAEGIYITKAAQRVVCYYANDDFAMPASKVANVKNAVFSRRIGHTGPEDMAKVANNVYAVNCDSFNNKFDLKGHSYFVDDGDKKSPAFQHVIKVIKAKKPKLGEREIEL